MTRIGEDAIPTLTEGIPNITEEFRIWGEVGNIITGDTASNVETILSLWDYLLLGAITLGLGIQGAMAAIQLAYTYAVLGAMALVSGSLSAFYMLQNGIEGIGVAILGIIQTTVNQAIDLINALIYLEHLVQMLNLYLI